MLKRLEGVATILAQHRRAPAVAVLAAPGGRRGLRGHPPAQARDAAGRRPRAGARRTPSRARRPPATHAAERRVVPQSVVSAQLANPFLVPDFSQAAAPKPKGRLAGWELIGPVLNAFEHPAPGAPACMELPDPRPTLLPPGLELMAHQAKLLAAVADGHRTFLLADEPGLGKTAQALLAAQVADAYPLLAVVPNVVKTNWAREAELWTPNRTVTVDPRRRRHHRRVRRHRGRQLRGPRPARRLDRRARLPRHGRRRGALHQEQEVAALPARPRGLRADPPAGGAAAADGADRHAADQRHRGLPGDLAVPRLDRGAQARATT